MTKKTRNTLGDLHNHLFEQLENLNDVSKKGEQLDEELKRTKGMVDISRTIIQNAKLVLDAEKFRDERLNAEGNDLRLLSGD